MATIWSLKRERLKLQGAKVGGRWPFSCDFNQSISLIATLRPESRIANDNAVEIIDENNKRNKQCAYMYIGAGRDV